MKRKGVEGIPAPQRLAPAANEEFTMSDLIGGRELDRLATPRSGWDPYEVWRTRVKASAKEKRGREPLR